MAGIYAIPVEYCKTSPSDMVAYYGVRVKGIKVSENILSIPILLWLGGHAGSTDYGDYPILFNSGNITCRSQAEPVTGCILVN